MSLIIKSIEYYLPETIVTNNDLQKENPDWKLEKIVEKNKEYVHASQVIGLSSHIIIIRHILRNVISPVFVIATIGFAFSILIESTLSFLGVGLAATQASLGTLIRIGNNFLFSGEWWIAFFPGLSLVTIVLSINIFGDWLRDALNPKLK